MFGCAFNKQTWQKMKRNLCQVTLFLYTDRKICDDPIPMCTKVSLVKTAMLMDNHCNLEVYSRDVHLI